jgi:hypothetical protein
MPRLELGDRFIWSALSLVKSQLISLPGCRVKAAISLTKTRVKVDHFRSPGDD